MKIISIIGRPGAGKGTQVEFLSEETGFEVIKTGNLLREKAKEKSPVGKIVKQTLSCGGLIPTPIVLSLWVPKLVEFYEDPSVKGIIFDGNPRKLYEAHLLEEAFEMFGWKNFRAVYIDISEEESFHRLQYRNRKDDSYEDIKERLSWFKGEVLPVTNYYEEKRVLSRIKGEGSVEEVRSNLHEKLSDFLNDTN